MPAGRPKTWTKERIAEEAVALEEWCDRGGTKWLKEFTIERKYPAQYLSDWAGKPEENPEFYEAYTRARDLVEANVINHAFDARNAGFHQFVLKNAYGWRESIEHTGNADAPLALNVVYGKPSTQDDDPPDES